MANKVLQIINIMIALDVTAEDVYKRLAGTTKNESLRKFWLEASEEEASHLKIWKELAKLARKNLLPDVFTDTDRIISELKKTQKRVDELTSNLDKTTSVQDSFLLAYRLEFYVMHPAIEQLLSYARTREEKTPYPEDYYESHIDSFISALNTYGKVTPELELLGETLKSLWKTNRSLALHSAHDELTGALNRRGFHNALGPLSHLAQRKQDTVGIIMTDIDKFKHINDKHGHQQGDEALKLVAEVLHKNSRSADVVGRYGGDEFVVFLSSVSPGTIEMIANDMRSKVHKETKKDINITISAGTSAGILLGDAEEAVDELIKQADMHLLEAKRKGGNTVN